MTAERIVVTRARGRIEAKGLLDTIVITTNGLHGVVHPIGERLRTLKVIWCDVLGIGGVVRPSPHPVKGAVQKGLTGLRRLILIAAPTVQDHRDSAVHVHMPPDAGVSVEQPGDVVGLRLRRRCRTTVHVLVTRVLGGADSRVRGELGQMIPQEVEVAVDVHTHATATVRMRSTVLSP
jgi:hypothetical protein